MVETIMVPMRDAVRLATDVYLPDGAGPFPVIMERTPYGRQETSRSEITANYLGLKQAGKGPRRLILGPWTHGDRSCSVFGDVSFGATAPLDHWAGDWRAFRLRFFDHVIKGTPLLDPNVWIFVMGGGSGRRTPDAALRTGTWIMVVNGWKRTIGRFLDRSRRRISCNPVAASTWSHRGPLNQ